jgi:hypothetical protein
LIDQSDLLLTVAEIAVAPAAFSGLVSVLGQARSQIDPRAAANRLQSVLMPSFLATAFALFPFLPTSFGVAPDLAWRLSAGIFSAAWFVYALSVARRISQLTNEGVERALLITPLSRVIAPLYAVGVIALLVTSIGFFPGQIRGVYLFGLFLLLFTAGSVFVRLFLSLARPSPPAA